MKTFKIDIIVITLLLICAIVFPIQLNSAPFALKKNTISNFEFISSNYGINFTDVSTAQGAGFWPRGSNNQYFFGSGFWFACEKFVIDAKDSSRKLNKFVSISYNPNNGRSWMVPGLIDEGQILNRNSRNNNIYCSTEYNNNGKSNDTNLNWPLWQLSPKLNNLSGLNGIYEADTLKRNSVKYQNGPLIQSDEDILSFYKETDLTYYDGGSVLRKAQGYPLGLDIQSKILQWKNKELNDIVIIRYEITNKSKDTLYNCNLAGVFDTDIALKSNSAEGASNDRMRYYYEDSTLNLAVAWTNTDKGEIGKGFGYVGVSFIETPVIDKNRYLVESKTLSNPKDQLGLKTFRSWNIADDKLLDSDRFLFTSSGLLDGDFGTGDLRMLNASGQFHFLPNQVARFAILIGFALPKKGGEADGSSVDIGNGDDISGNSLTSKVKRGKEYYYGNYTPNAIEDEFEVFQNFNVSPNPAQDILEIRDIEFTNNQTAQIISIQGIEIKQINASRFINISDLADGIYYIKIGTKTQKFVKIGK
ncbi:MAG: T9SS type A sorting domain-containing protein [Candidatus Kapabacteria bacterium]|nr:T9SS type A sorting domain-containing protein [Candidatus Kapabacteria bacterium]